MKRVVVHSQQVRTHRAAWSPAPQQDRERTERAKERKVVSQDKGSLVSEINKRGKKTPTAAKATTYHLPQADWCTASLQATTALEDTQHMLTLLPLLVFNAEHDIIWHGIALCLVWDSSYIQNITSYGLLWRMLTASQPGPVEGYTDMFSPQILSLNMGRFYISHRWNFALCWIAAVKLYISLQQHTVVVVTMWENHDEGCGKDVL